MVAGLAVGCGNQGNPVPGPTVLVVVEEGGEPLEGAFVVTHHPDGTAFQLETTGVDGTVDIGAVADGAVTVIVDNGIGPYARTVFEVNPEDEVVFGGDRVGTIEDGFVARITLPGTFAGATSYAIDVGCATANVPDPTVEIPIQLTTACGSMFDVFATASDAVGVTATTASVNIPASQAQIDVTLGAWGIAQQSVTLDLLNAPASTVAATGSAYKLSRGTVFALEGPSVQNIAPSEDASFVFLVPPTVGSLVGYQAGIEYSDNSSASEVIGQASVGSGSFVHNATVDLPPQMLPPTYNAGVVTTDVSAPFPARDATFVRLSWPALEWELVSETQTTMTIPQLPDSLAAYRPPTETPSIRAEATNFNWVSSYDGILRFEYSPIQGASQAFTTYSVVP